MQPVITRRLAIRRRTRVSIIVPLTRDVTQDEFVASRFFADEWCIDQFTKLLRPHQLLYWRPAANGEYTVAHRRRVAGPERILAQHRTGRIAALPHHPGKVLVRESKKAGEDPLTRMG
jgi:hypothetical protein